MKCTRKLASLLLALVMVFALATTAFATETGTTTTGTITVANPVEGRTYTAYKVFDVTYDESGHYSYTLPAIPTADIKWNSMIRAYTTKTNSGLIAHEVETLGVKSLYFTTDENFSPADFAAYLKGRLGNDNPTGHELIKQEDGTVSVSGLDLGYYFVASDTGALCNLTTTAPTVTIHDKNDMPFEKKADKTNADVGQIVNYTVTGKVPDYTGFTSYTYKVADTMSDGLTFKKDVKVTVGGADVTTACTVTYDVNKNANSFTVTIPVLSQKYTIGAEIKVTYSAVLNEKAIAKVETNSATLTYSNDPTTNETKTTTPVEQKVYNAELVIDKHQLGNTAIKLPEAKFVLYKEVTTEGAAEATKMYYKWNEAAKKVEWVTEKNSATTVTTDDNGAAFFRGIAEGDYYLEETKAPAGYNQLTGPVEISINNLGTQASLSITVSVSNQAGTLLPSTGGMGTTVFYVLGTVLVLGAVVLLVTKKRMSDANR